VSCEFGKGQLLAKLVALRLVGGSVYCLLVDEHLVEPVQLRSENVLTQSAMAISSGHRLIGSSFPSLKSLRMSALACRVMPAGALGVAAPVEGLSANLTERADHRGWKVRHKRSLTGEAEAPLQAAFEHARGSSARAVGAVPRTNSVMTAIARVVDAPVRLIVAFMFSPSGLKSLTTEATLGDPLVVRCVARLGSASGRALSCQEPVRDAPDRVRADDVTLRVDTRCGGGGGTRDINAYEAARRVEQKPVSNGPNRVHANDVTPRVDINGLCRGGAGEVNRPEVAMLVEQEAMSGPASRVLANDVAPRVDPEEPRGGGARHLNRREAAMLVKQEPMKRAPSRVLANDVTLRIDPEGLGGGSARDINGGEAALDEQEAMSDSPGHVEADDVTLRVDGAGPSSYGSRDYEVGNDALVDQEAIRKGSPDTVEADDVTFRVDITWHGGRSPRDVNSGEVNHLGTGGRK